jgi:hypothetical protein
LQRLGRERFSWQTWALTLLALTVFGGCGETKFGAPVGRGDSSNSKNQTPNDHEVDQAEHAKDGKGGKDTAEGDDSSSNGGIGDQDGKASGGSGGLGENGDGASGGLEEDDETVRRRQCWFAVSGTWVGVSLQSIGIDYKMRFPATNSGNPVGPGERFDAVGGIYLAARSQPYVAGGGEIDAAIAGTFDSIVVAPGMSVEIRNAQGAVLFKGNGPFIGESDAYPQYAGMYFNLLKTTSGLPKWMNDYVAARTAVEMVPGLQTATWVKVSVIPKSRCDKQ